MKKPAIAFVVIAIIVGWFGGHFSFLQSQAANRDSISYWSAGRLLLEHQNPYDSAANLALERGEGFSGYKAMVWRVPPWSIAAALPFAFLNPYWSWFAIVALSIAALVVCTRICWKLFGDSRERPDGYYLAAYLFAPVLGCIATGQIGLLLLTGVLLFIEWNERRPFLAGLALFLPFIKPHLFVPFGLVLLAWVIWERRWQILLGFVVALEAGLIAALAMAHSVFSGYSAMFHEQSVSGEFIPSLSGWLRVIVAPTHFAVQFIPLLVVSILALAFWWIFRASWGWTEHGMALLLVSVLASPYSWFPDEVILLPVIFQSMMMLFGKAGNPGKLAYLFPALNCVLFIMAIGGTPLTSGSYAWSGILWAVWYVRGLTQRPIEVKIPNIAAVHH